MSEKAVYNTSRLVLSWLKNYQQQDEMGSRVKVNTDLHIICFVLVDRDHSAQAQITAADTDPWEML